MYWLNLFALCSTEIPPSQEAASEATLPREGDAYHIGYSKD